MPTSPTQAIQGLLSAYPGRDAASGDSLSVHLPATKDQDPSGTWPRPTQLQPKRRWLRQGEPCPGGRGPRQARHGWRAPESGHGCPAEGKAAPGRQGTATHRSPHERPVGHASPQMGEEPKKSPPSRDGGLRMQPDRNGRSEGQTSELQSLMRISYAVFCLKKKK